MELCANWWNNFYTVFHVSENILIIMLLVFPDLSSHRKCANWRNNFCTVFYLQVRTRSLVCYRSALTYPYTENVQIDETISTQFLHESEKLFISTECFRLLWFIPTQKNAQIDETISTQFLPVSENSFIIMLSVCSDLSLDRKCVWWNNFYTVFTSKWKHVHHYVIALP